jgi:hypothetical protein
MPLPFQAQLGQFSDQTLVLYLLKAKTSKWFRVKGFCHGRRAVTQGRHVATQVIGVKVSVKLNNFRGKCSSF